MLRRLAIAAVVGVAATVASVPATGADRAPTLRQILDRKGENVALVLGTSDFAVGTVRLSFLVVASDGSVDYQPAATVWLAPSRDMPATVVATARAERVGVPGRSDPGELRELFVAELAVRKPGTYWVVAQPTSGKEIQGYQEIVVRPNPIGPAVGSKAYPSKTPTLATAGGDLARLTTATPPDTGLLRYSVADSLRRHVPFVVVFATPKFCTSRTCGPVVEIVDAVRRRLAASTGVRFIHVEVYKDNDLQKGPNQWVREWHLPSEPWTFLVGRDGTIEARFEGSFSQRELVAAVERYLG